MIGGRRETGMDARGLYPVLFRSPFQGFLFLLDSWSIAALRFFTILCCDRAENVQSVD
jgi:hypothetical protein